MDEVLGTDSDSNIARLLNLNKHSVSYRRKILNIAPYHASQPLVPDWNIISLLGTDTDANIAKFQIMLQR